jgi:uncharacterized protein YcbK (DUF882 family)
MSHDFTCRCDRGDKCDAVEMNEETLSKFYALEKEHGKLIITSASRCKYHNEKVGGSSNSYHLSGRAIDVKVKSGIEMAKICLLAIKHGFNGIGISKGFIHLDTRTGPLVIFGY